MKRFKMVIKRFQIDDDYVKIVQFFKAMWNSITCKLLQIVVTFLGQSDQDDNIYKIIIAKWMNEWVNEWKENDTMAKCKSILFFD